MLPHKIHSPNLRLRIGMNLHSTSHRHESLHLLHESSWRRLALLTVMCKRENANAESDKNTKSVASAATQLTSRGIHSA